MKTAVGALRGHLVRIAEAIGLEGTFLAIGTGLVAFGQGIVPPAVVIGAVLFGLGLALAIPVRRSS